MHKAFVFGKFLPFHKGHEAMINFAAGRCDLLTVLVCCSNLETVSVSERKNWLVDTFYDRPNIVVQIFEYDEDVLPNTSTTSADVSKVWAAAFKVLFPDYTTVVTSEGYGSLVAGYMGIEHMSFDVGRRLFPVSGTQIRKDIAGNWRYLPDGVKESYALKVVILGTESTGKTTLTNQLARHFGCSSVMEAGRELIPDSNSFGMDDLYKVAAKHAEQISAAARGESALIIIDTDIHITISYALYMFGVGPNFDAEIYRRNRASLYLYLNSDVEYVQDGTRLSEADRNLLDASHRRVLHDYHVKFEEISGSWDERFEKAVSLINELVEKQR